MPEEDRELVEGYRDAMSFVLRRGDDPAFSWDRGLIVGLHDRVLAGRHDLEAGRLRTEKPVFVLDRSTGERVFQPPAGEDVPALVEEACARVAHIVGFGCRAPPIAHGAVHAVRLAELRCGRWDCRGCRPEGPHG
mgnify:CR=1 FL=1